MSSFKLNLPTDIPWKRLCASKDMMDTKICDEQRPRRWHSSIAVFEYQPANEYQTYDDMMITYFKVACSITGYQAGDTEIGLHTAGFDNFRKPENEILSKTLLDYYPCYRAILEFSVAPKKEGVSLDKYPYFADFEPKKRELYELVTETGEVMSRSLKGMSVGKGSTNLKTHEVLDVDHGFNIGANVKVGVGESGVGGGFNFGRSGEWGTKDMSQQDASNVRTSDDSQESRETESHTTQLSQLYHQLDSYHLGTNRAVFFVLPRPHTVQTEFTFVDGPRNIEGIQEFFFIVVRPKDVKEICVEAYLETGHLAKIPLPPTPDEPTERIDSWTLKFDAKFDKTADELDEAGYESFREVEPLSTLYNPPLGWVIDLTKGRPPIEPGWSLANAGGQGGGFIRGEVEIEPIYNWKVNEVDENHLLLWGEVSRAFWNDHGVWSGTDDTIFQGHLEVTLNIYLKKVNSKQSSKGNTEHLYLTARSLCCCEKEHIEEPHISWEKPFELVPAISIAEKSSDGPISIKQANMIGKLMGREFIKSRNDIAHRYTTKSIHLPQTHFFATTLSKSLQGTPEDERVETINYIDRTIKNKILEFAPTINLSGLLKMPPQMQKDLFDLSDAEVQKLRKSLTETDPDKRDPKLKWLTPKQQRDYLAKKKKKNTKSKGDSKSGE